MKQTTQNMFICTHCGREHPTNTEACPESGEKIASHHKIVGNILENKYMILRVLGEGGMGVVYEAKHSLIGRRLAVKVLYPETATNQEIVERFYNEARTAASIGHDHIIEITDMGFYDKSPFIVMEYLEGTSLAGFIENRVLDVPEAVAIILQVLDALSAVHAKGVIHRDLKPENVFIVEKGGRNDFVKILDFGISKLKTPQSENMHLTRTGTILGTPYYMAPEQAAGRKNQDHRIDIYAAGVILYEMVTGRLPFQGENYNALIAAILTEEAARPAVHNPAIPPELDNVIMAAINKQPHLRFPNASNFMDALRPFAPSWALRPSKTPGMARTASGQPAAVAPTIAQKPSDSLLMSSPASTGTGQWAEAPARKGKGALVGAVIGVAVLLLALAGAGALLLPRLLGKGGDKGEGPAAAAGQPANVAIVPPLVPPAATADAATAQEAGGTAAPPAGGAEEPKKTVSVKFSGLPEWAVTKIDGTVAGTNPYALAPSKEKRTILVEAPGYEPWTAQEVLDGDREIRVTMEKKKGGGKGGAKGGTTTAETVTPPPPGVTEPPKEPVKEPPTKKQPEQGEKGIYKGKVKIIGVDYPE